MISNMFPFTMVTVPMVPQCHCYCTPSPSVWPATAVPSMPCWGKSTTSVHPPAGWCGRTPGWIVPHADACQSVWNRSRDSCMTTMMHAVPVCSAMPAIPHDHIKRQFPPTGLLKSYKKDAETSTNFLYEPTIYSTTTLQDSQTEEAMDVVQSMEMSDASDMVMQDAKHGEGIDKEGASESQQDRCSPSKSSNLLVHHSSSIQTSYSNNNPSASSCETSSAAPDNIRLNEVDPVSGQKPMEKATEKYQSDALYDDDWLAEDDLPGSCDELHRTVSAPSVSRIHWIEPQMTPITSAIAGLRMEEYPISMKQSSLRTSLASSITVSQSMETTKCLGVTRDFAPCTQCELVRPDSVDNVIDHVVQNHPIVNTWPSSTLLLLNGFELNTPYSSIMKRYGLCYNTNQLNGFKVSPRIILIPCNIDLTSTSKVSDNTINVLFPCYSSHISSY